MAKYIDADKLKYLINEIYPDVQDSYTNGQMKALNKVYDFIDSLQQEQQEVDLEKEIEEYWLATTWSKGVTLGKFKVIARYFYGLGQLNSK